MVDCKQNLTQRQVRWAKRRRCHRTHQEHRRKNSQDASYNHMYNFSPLRLSYKPPTNSA